MTPQNRIVDRETKMKSILGPADDPRELTDENRVELRHLEEANAKDAEQAAMLERAYGTTSVTDTVQTDTEFDELRHSCTLTNYLDAAVRGRSISGPEAELAAETGCGAGDIPHALFDRDEIRHDELRADAPSTAPASAGTNVAAVQPKVYAPSIAGMFNIDMPTVRPGSHAEPIISTGASAGFSDGSGRDSTAVAVTITSTEAKMFSGRLSYRELDRLKVGTDTWEPALRTNQKQAMSDGLNTVLLQAAKGANDPEGLVTALTAPSDPAATNVGFDDYIKNLIADELDGVFATMTSELRIAVNSTIKSSMMTVFRDIAASDLGSISIWDYIAGKVNMLMFNSRMPAAASNVSLGIAHRIGRTDLKLATMPVWGNLTISDIYSDSKSATTHVTMHQFCGDLILNQSGAYSLFKTKTA